MLRNRGHWRRRPISLTPLIDIIFLLLLFFMLSSTFTRFAEVPLVNAGAGTATGAAPVFLQLGTDALRVNGEVIGFEVVADRLSTLRDGEEATALITLDDTVSSQRLVDLLVLLQGLPWLSVAVLE